MKKDCLTAVRMVVIVLMVIFWVIIVIIKYGVKKSGVDSITEVINGFNIDNNNSKNYMKCNDLLIALLMVKNIAELTVQELKVLVVVECLIIQGKVK